MGRVGKATKKFQKNHLKGAINKRKEHQKISKWKKARNAPSLRGNAAARASDNEGEENQEKGKSIEEMDVDEFLSSGFKDIADDDESKVDDSDDEAVLRSEDDESDMELPVGVFEEIETDDEDTEEAEEGSIKANNQTLKAKASKHKAELEALKKKDPEFYNYLQETDKGLLDFEDTDGEGDEDEEEDKNEVELETVVEGKEGTSAAAAESKTLTTAMVAAWCTATKDQYKIGAVRNLLRAFRSACHYGDEVDGKTDTLNIGSSHVFNKVMVFVLREMDGVFRVLLGMTKDSAVGNMNLEKRPRWKKLEPLIKSFLGNGLHVLGQMTDPEMITFTLRRLGASTDLMGPFERITRKMLRAVLEVFAGGDTQDSAQLRVAAILFIRRLAVAVPETLDSCLRGVYRTYAASAKFCTVSSAPAISFMADCVVEMFGLDLSASYSHIFVALRQLAVLLRNALTNKEKEAFRQVYCWQAVWCMEVWSRVLIAYAEREELKPLVYPLVQIITGAARLLPAARYLPLRLRLVRMLNRLSGATGKFIPVSSLLLDVLKSKELSRPPQTSTGKPADFVTVLKVAKSVVRTPSFQQEVVAQALELLCEHLNHWGFSPAFPELLHIPIIALRSFVKSTSVEKFRKAARALVDAAERQADWVKAKRSHVSFAPKDAAAVHEFMRAERAKAEGPLAKYCTQLKTSAKARQALQRTERVHTSDVHKRQGGTKRCADASEELDNDEDASSGDDSDSGSEGEDDGEKVFSGSWMPSKEGKPKQPKQHGLFSDGLEDEDTGALMGDDKLVDIDLSEDEIDNLNTGEASEENPSGSNDELAQKAGAARPNQGKKGTVHKGSSPKGGGNSRGGKGGGKFKKGGWK